jgi:hypothetical protein
MCYYNMLILRTISYWLFALVCTEILGQAKGSGLTFKYY